MYKYLYLASLCIIAAITFTVEVTDSSNSQLYGDIYNPNAFELLSLTRERQQHICQREVPAVFFQTQKDQVIRGNGSTIFYNRIEICCMGYRRDLYTGECIADCSKTSPDNCRNGFCREPEHCQCFDEFVRNEHGACIHTCPIACQHGKCYLNGTCSCHSGYKLDQETRKFCRPHCENACGTLEECVAPGKCDCIMGYHRTADFGCQPVCTPDCGHGKCVGPNQCECFAGFMKRPQRDVCEAECYINCENGFCESRYKCQCRQGYLYDMNTTSCLPECDENCGHGNGVCIAPGVCRCFEGYELKGNGCEPKCEGSCGSYGQCLEPNICGCGPGQQHCLDGLCDVNGHCICPNGQNHFIDRCLESDNILEQLTSNETRSQFNHQLAYEFNGLVGRLFNLS